MSKRQKFLAKKEQKKLKLIVSQLPDELAQITEGLVEDASFMAEELEKLRNAIEEKGWSETYTNGANQSGRKVTVEGDSYLKLQKSYAAVIKQLTDLLPKNSEVSGAAKEIMEFVGSTKKK